MKKILVTGGTGYIGSHTCIELLNSGYELILLDNLSNSKIDVVEKIKNITGRDFKFYQCDYNCKEELEKVFSENEIGYVINFAGFKAVGESVEKPLEYYINNVYGALNLLQVMKEHNVKNFVFSSSATVYGDPKKVPITEEFEVGDTTNPYGTSKYMIEVILKDLYKSDPTWNIVILRYFNPIGAHKSGLIGENPRGIPNNLLPYVTRVANGSLKELSVYGNDYETPDGTGIRDYIHVVDLAIGHVKAIKKIQKDEKLLNIYNLGTGHGYSVLDIVKTFEKVNNVKVPYKITTRRLGDIAICYADTKKAKEEIDFEAKFTLEDMVRDAWNYQKNN